MAFPLLGEDAARGLRETECESCDLGDSLHGLTALRFGLKIRVVPYKEEHYKFMLVI